MANEINTQPSSTGNFVDSNGDTVNLVNLLIEKGAADQPIRQDVRNTNNNQPAKTGNMVASNNNVYNIIDLLKHLILHQALLQATSYLLLTVLMFKP